MLPSCKNLWEAVEDKRLRETVTSLKHTDGYIALVHVETS